jgi:hypothetical protein
MMVKIVALVVCKQATIRMPALCLRTGINYYCYYADKPVRSIIFRIFFHIENMGIVNLLKFCLISLLQLLYAGNDGRGSRG